MSRSIFDRGCEVPLCAGPITKRLVVQYTDHAGVLPVCHDHHVELSRWQAEKDLDNLLTE